MPPMLHEANQRLLALRAARRQRQGTPTAPPADPAPAADSLPVLAEIVANLPPHLGWGSQPLTAALRAAERENEPNTAVPAPDPPPPTSTPPDTPNPDLGPAAPPAIRLHPDIGLGMLQQGQTAAGRIWLLLRGLDNGGRGWVSIETARTHLTGKGSPLRAAGWRQLRNLLRAGQGVFWRRDKTRIWLHGAAQTAVRLGVTRLRGRPVALPTACLTQGVGAFKAHCLAAFHSGRKAAAPISRTAVSHLSGVPARSQRRYERRAGVRKQTNLAIGERDTPLTAQERAWTQGKAAFIFTDHRGRLGKAGGRYRAWRLPNSYGRVHTTCPRGRQRKINRQIDLVTKGRGNGLRAQKLFHADGGQAGKAYDGESDRFWPGAVTKGVRLWYTLTRRPSGGRGAG